MSSNAKRRSRSAIEEELHVHLAIRVTHHNARVRVSVNPDVYNQRPSWASEDDPVYTFSVELAITGISTYPEERAGDTYELTIHGDDAPSRGHDLKLKDLQARDAHGSRRYRTYRGKDVPVYDRPNSFGLLNKARGEARWTGWLFLPTRSASDMLVLLSQRQDLFLALHERRNGRTRWIHGMSLQTSDPSEE